MTTQERRAVGSLALLYSLRMLGLFMVLPLMALYASDMPGATPASIGLALGVYGLAQALLQIPFGWLSDHVGRKPVILGGLLLFFIGSVVAARAVTLEGIIFGRALQGAGAIASTVMALVADLTREEQRTKAMALVGMSIGLSFALALVLGPAVAGVGGLPAVFWFTALLSLLGAVIVIRGVPAPPAASSAPGHDGGPRIGLIRRTLGDAELLRLDFGIFALHFVMMACFLVVPGMLEEIAGIGRERHWLVYLPALALSLLGMVPLMILAERRGKPRPVFLSAIALLCVAILSLVSAGSPAPVYVGLWLFFVGFNYLEATLPSMVSKAVFAGGKGTAMGVYSTSQFLGAFAGGAIGGWLLQHWSVQGLATVALTMAAVWWLLVLRSPPARAVAAAEGVSAPGQEA